MCCQWKWVVLWSLWAARLVPQRTAPRRLPHGAVRGLLAPDGSHELYFGIPYATVTRRYQAPGPAPRWEGVLDAEHEHSRCPQSFGAAVVGTEQCLTINVYVPLPRTQADRPLPVMLFVHGGGFKEGSSSRLLYGPDHLVRRSVVLVTFNYRLNVLGFLCLRTEDAPGNAGLKDQLAAMRWVQRNIRAFGGDPDDVTLFGESAGAASVSYHLVSPASAGLFHRAILQSGSSLAPWALQRDPLRIAQELARALGHGIIEDPRLLYDVFTNTPLTDLVNTQLPKTEGQLLIAHLPYVPCIERRLDGVEPFLTKAPFDIYTRGNYTKVPVIIGITEEEGYFFTAMETDDTLLKIRFDKAFPIDLDIPETERQTISHEIKELYMNNADISRDTVVELSRLIGDAYFGFPTSVETELMLASGGHPVYSYVLRHDGYRNFAKLVVAGPRFWRAPGATHADDLFYLFNPLIAPTLFEGKMISVISTAWTNFAKYGDPTPESGGRVWAPCDAHAPAGGAALELSVAPRPVPLRAHRAEHFAFWKRLYDKYRSVARVV